MPPERKYKAWYNVIPKPSTGEATYHFAFVNSSESELTDMINKAMEKFPPFEIRSVSGNAGSLFYKIISVDTYNSVIDLKLIAKTLNSELVRDKNLYNRTKNPSGLEIYFCKKIENMPKSP